MEVFGLKSEPTMAESDLLTGGTRFKYLHIKKSSIDLLSFHTRFLFVPIIYWLTLVLLFFAALTPLSFFCKSNNPIKINSSSIECILFFVYTELNVILRPDMRQESIKGVNLKQWGNSKKFLSWKLQNTEKNVLPSRICKTWVGCCKLEF